MTFTLFLNDRIDEARQRGIEWARSCAALSISAESREYLESEAKAMAGRLPTTMFDTVANPHDKLRADEHGKHLEDLDNAEMALANGVATARQRQEERAKLGPETEAPKASTWLTAGGTTLFAAGFALGIYDWIHDRITDPYIAAVIALIPSAALGIFVVRSLTNPDSPRKRTLGMIAGIGISLATGILRYAFSPDDLIVAIALTLLELFIVFFLDWHGKHLQAKYQQWEVERAARKKADHLVTDASQNNAATSQVIANLKQKIAEHVDSIALRSLICQKYSEIEAALINAIMAGAHKGIADNQGLKRGVMTNTAVLS